jgi:hypothetical protein
MVLRDFSDYSLSHFFPTVHLSQVRWLLKTLKVRVLGTVSIVLLFVVNLIFSLLFIILKPWMHKTVLRRFSGFMMTYSMTPLMELQFDFGRMLSYVPYLMKAEDRLFSLRNKMRTADELVGSPRLPTDEIFISHVILRSPLAFYTTNEANKLVVDLSAMNDVVQYDNTYYEVNGIEVQKGSQEITIFMKSADPTKAPTPVTRKKDGDAVFDRALQSAMATICYFVPGIGHSWVHFLFPDAVAATVHNDLPRSSVLYKLLEPHTRYTSRINWEALGARGSLVIGGSSLIRMAAEASTTAPRGVPGTALTRKFEPVTSLPITADEFVRKNSERTTGYYFSEEFACPPKWLEGASADLPYIKSLKRFYPIVRKHVAKVLEFEKDKSIIDRFIASVDNKSRIDDKCLDLYRFDPIDAIATLIFDAAFIHPTDHYFTYKIFHQTRYGVGTLRHPYTRDWYPGCRVPEDVMDPEDRVRYAGFADVFVQFNDSKMFSNSMKSLKYSFKQKALKKVHLDFVNEIYTEQDKMETEGDIFCPVEKLARSVCF